MNNLQFDNIEYNDFNKQLYAKVFSDNKNLFALCIEKSEILLELEFSIETQAIISLNGSIGEAILKAPITDEQKIERCQEALQNILWDYFHPPKQKMEIK